MRGASKSVNPDVKGAEAPSSPRRLPMCPTVLPRPPRPLSPTSCRYGSPSSQTLILSDPSKVSLQTGIRPSTVGALSTVPEDLVVASSSTGSPAPPFTAQLPHGETFQQTSPFHGTISMNRPRGGFRWRDVLILAQGTGGSSSTPAVSDGTPHPRRCCTGARPPLREPLPQFFSSTRRP